MKAHESKKKYKFCEINLYLFSTIKLYLYMVHVYYYKLKYIVWFYTNMTKVSYVFIDCCFTLIYVNYILYNY